MPAPVSVVVPTHNRPQLMREAVMSVVKQSYPGDIEIVVVFDACDPESLELPIPASRTLRTMRNGRTRGLAGSRNTGILAASHGIVGFLDDDDVWLPAKLEQQVPLLEANPDAVMVGTAMVVDNGSRQYERLVPCTPVTKRSLLRDRMAGLHSSSFLFRRDALLSSPGLIDEQLPASYGEDYDILLRSAAVGDIPVVNKPLVKVAWQGQSMFFGKWGLYAEALEYLLAKHPEFGEDRRGQGRIEAQIAMGHAAMGDREKARRWGRLALRHDPIRVRAYLALLISTGLVSIDTVAATAQRFGKGL